MISQYVMRTAKNKKYDVKGYAKIRLILSIFCEELYDMVLENGYVSLGRRGNANQLGFGIRKRKITKYDLKRTDLVIVKKRGNYNYEFYVDARNSNKGYFRWEAPEKYREKLRNVLETTNKEYPYVD